MRNIDKKIEELNITTEDLKRLAFDLRPDWKQMTTIQTVSRDKVKERDAPKILAQCCKPGPCSPRTCKPKSRS